MVRRNDVTHSLRSLCGSFVLYSFSGQVLDHWNNLEDSLDMAINSKFCSLALAAFCNATLARCSQAIFCLVVLQRSVVALRCKWD